MLVLDDFKRDLWVTSTVSRQSLNVRRGSSKACSGKPRRTSSLPTLICWAFTLSGPSHSASVMVEA